MIVEMKPLSMAEVKDMLEDSEEKKELNEYLKTYGKLKKADADKLVEEIRALNNVKLKEDYIMKIADFLPRDVEDLNKIFHDISLDEKETNDILEITKKY